MSLLPLQAIDEFQVLWKQRYGVELSRDEATLRAHQVFTLVRMLTQKGSPTRGDGSTNRPSPARLAQNHAEDSTNISTF